MAHLFADESFDYPVVIELRNLGHDVLTAQDAGQASQGIPDTAVLAYATSVVRAVLTFTHRHFRRLHSIQQPHAGIISCTHDDDVVALAQRIHQAISNLLALDNQFLRIIRPAKP
ncbi:MAG TPA: DUF5615 family PIN-like protein [Gemmataceae bacterium]|nr:DUF5615 family PIN-like protein [Gemmataceae bacterium]